MLIPIVSLLLCSPLVAWTRSFDTRLPSNSDTLHVNASLTNLHSRSPNITTNGLQNIVGWDDKSLLINGKRVMIWAGEYHPFRLPSPALWLDVFQKIKASGYNAVSFYLYWALFEGEQGHFRAEGQFAIEPFLEAAKTAGIYLIARPGPYINSETSGGGFPGWLQRCPSALRSNEAGYLDAAVKYTTWVAEKLAPYQITRGGPIILYQIENEYSSDPLSGEYMQALEDAVHKAGIVVPTTFNDNYAGGHFVNGTGAVDIYGSDGYPFGYGSPCNSDWPSNGLPDGTINYMTHMQQNPLRPFGILEYQGGNPVGWGYPDPATCGVKFGADWERLFYKNMQANSVKIFNVYMTYGGTNWGGISFPGGVTTYDQYSILSEDRQVTREKFSEAKLQASFLQASPAYLTTTPNFQPTDFSATSSDITLSSLEDAESSTVFLVTRHSDYTSRDKTSYQLKLALGGSRGTVTVPQLSNASLTLNGRDSKVMVINYAVGRENLIYSTAEVFSWVPAGAQGNVLVLYGGEGETHELAFDRKLGKPRVTGSNVKVDTVKDMTVIQWEVQTSRRILTFENRLTVYLLWRNDAYNLWSLDAGNNQRVLVSGGYLIRNATVSGDTLQLTGDINSTTTLEALAVPPFVRRLAFNGNRFGGLKGTVRYNAPQFSLPDLTKLTWNYHSSLPEIQPSCDDSKWIVCNQTTTNSNTPLVQSVSTYSGDYGFTVGTLLYRGHFTSTGNETSFQMTTQGGTGYSHSLWLHGTYLGSWAGDSGTASYTQTFSFPAALKSGSNYILTVVTDNMGLEMSDYPHDKMKTPCGLLQWNLSNRSDDSIAWKITGNLGGEQYQDKARGPLNEGGLYAERQGWHLPGAPTTGPSWTSRSPLQGLSGPGIGFYSTSFDLNLPKGYDIPLSFIFDNATNGQTGNFRLEFFVNGYKMGKYVHNLGPQNIFPAPEGILNHQGKNSLSILLWSMEQGGSKLSVLKLEAQATVQSGYGPVAQAPQPGYVLRSGAY